MGASLESKFQGKLIKELKALFEGSIITKLDSWHKQSIPDLLILFKDKWATLECKKSATASHRPNQDLYVERMNTMSFSRFIFPENKDAVLKELAAFFNNEERT